MTNSLKCPFCGAKLETHYYEYENSRGDTCYGDSGMLVCASCGDGCSSHRKPMLPEIWQALIDGKKVQDAIQKIKDIVYPALDREFYSELRNDMLYIGRIIVSVEKTGAMRHETNTLYKTCRMPFLFAFESKPVQFEL